MAPRKAGASEYRRRFWARVDRTPGCWTWLAGRNGKGYGYFWINGRTIQAYKVADDWRRGPLPEGQERHHVCENILCVRPHRDHVARVTVRAHRLATAGTFPAVNAAKTECPQGHPYDNVNTFYSPAGDTRRRCRACSRRQNRGKRAL